MTETAKERTDRQLTELLNELRVALPGAQVLLAFLLTAPFQSRFRETSSFEQAVLYAGILTTAWGALLLMAPSIYHRIRWREGGKEDVVRVGHLLFLAGTACLAAGLLCAVYVASSVLFGVVAAMIGVAGILVIVGGAWYALPLRRSRDPRVRDAE